jgi:hypothetical protein
MLVVVSRGVVIGSGGVLAEVVEGGMLFGRLLRTSMSLGRIVVLFGRNPTDGVISPVSSTNLQDRQYNLKNLKRKQPRILNCKTTEGFSPGFAQGRVGGFILSDPASSLLPTTPTTFSAPAPF